MISREEILSLLDQEAKNYTFPMLDNGYYYHGDQKMIIFRDESRWAILIEIFAFNNHDYDVNGFITIAYFYGNCLLKDYDDVSFNCFVSDSDRESFLYDKENYIPYLDNNVKTIKIRDKIIPLNTNPDFLKQKQIDLEYPNRIAPWDLMRSIVPEYSDHIWLTKTEISLSIPSDLPIFLELNEWLHPDLVDNQLPSETETFIQIAEALSTGNKVLYKPTVEPNTHWKYWPEGGTL